MESRIEGNPAPAAVQRALSQARLLVLDVDGVLTDGRVVYVGELESQAFCVQDGQGLAWLRKAGIQIAWITGRGSLPTERRAAELGISELHMQSGPKRVVLKGVQERLGIAPEETIAMGDDLPDLAMAELAALFITPANGRPEVRAQAGWTTVASGGSGAVREVADAILRAQGKLQDCMPSTQA